MVTKVTSMKNIIHNYPWLGIPNLSRFNIRCNDMLFSDQETYLFRLLRKLNNHLMQNVI